MNVQPTYRATERGPFTPHYGVVHPAEHLHVKAKGKNNLARSFNQSYVLFSRCRRSSYIDAFTFIALPPLRPGNLFLLCDFFKEAQPSAPARLTFINSPYAWRSHDCDKHQSCGDCIDPLWLVLVVEGYKLNMSCLMSCPGAGLQNPMSHLQHNLLASTDQPAPDFDLAKLAMLKYTSVAKGSYVLRILTYLA